MTKLFTFALLMVLAILAAGLFGALHNQLSYSVGPDYFHSLKFDQFAIETRNRIGAAQVGWMASWWMGVVIGMPVFGLGMVLLRRRETFLAAGLAALGLALFCALLGACLGLALAMIWPDLQERIPFPDSLPDSVGFFRAALMHEGAYLGGALGLLLGLWTMWRARKFERSRA